MNRGRAGFLAAAAVLFLGYLGAAVWFVRCGRVNLDEGWYLYAAQLVYAGSLPYRDFAYFQAPLLPYVYGAPQLVFGSGLLVGRITSLCLGAMTIGLAARLAAERGGRLACLFVLAVAPLTPLAVWCFTTTRTEPLVAFFLMAAAFLLLRRSTSVAASAGALAAATLAVATRISASPALLLVAAWVIARHRRSRRELVLVLAPGAVLLLGLGALVLAAAPDVVLFNLVTAQAGRHDQLQPAEAIGVARLLLRRLRDLAALHVGFGIVPALSLACASGGALAWLARRRTVGRSSSSLYVVAGGLGVAAYVPNLVLRVAWPEYFSAVFPLFLVVLACALGRAHRAADRVGRQGVLVAAAVLACFQGAVFAREVDRSASGQDADIEEVAALGRYLAEVVPPGRGLLTLDTYLAVESGLRVPRGFEMGLFAYFPNRSDEDGQRLHLLTDSRLAAALRSDAVGAVALSDRSLGVLVKKEYAAFRFYARLSETELRSALPGLEGYSLERVVPDFGQFRDNLYVWFPEARGESPSDARP